MSPQRKPKYELSSKRRKHGPSAVEQTGPAAFSHLAYLTLSPSLTRTARQIKFILDRLSVYQPMTKILVSSEQRVRVGTDLTPHGHGDKRAYVIKVQGDEVHAVLGESRGRIPEILLDRQFWGK